MKVLYTAAATATGGRNGQVKSDNGVLDLQVRAPRAMGGDNNAGSLYVYELLYFIVNSK